jgi:ATP-dependent exoDNAse (exonuclease V) alpha subunit
MRAEADDLPDHRKRDGTAEAFRSAQSLQMFLSSPSLQAAVEPGDLVILDEAGAASVEDVHRLMAFAKLRECRVLFSGDPRQHASVEAGDALRVLLKRSEIHRSALFEIVRQNPDAMEGKYLKAAKLFSQGKTTSAFAKLDEVNAIFEHKGKAREEAIAEAIVQEMREGKSVVAVNPSHRENGAVCDAVRQRLKAKGMLQDERTIHAYRSLGWTYAEKRATNKICVGQVIEITRGPSKGKAFDVVAVDKGKVTARNGEGEERVFDRRNARMIDVCERFDLNVAVGDRLITRAGVRCGNGEVINGEKVTVTGFDEAGNVMGAKGKLITTKNLAHAYAMTSHRSQGDTADTVIFGLDRKSVRWADQKLAYVAGTRGRTRIQIFVENKADLTGLQTRPGDRKAASEMEIRQPEKLSHEVRHLMEQAEHHRRVLEERQKHRGYEMAVE